MERSPKSVWGLLVSSDQAHYPVSKDKRYLTESANGFIVVPLRIENVTLPLLDPSGLLLHKVIQTHHRERTEHTWMDIKHIGTSQLKSKIFNCQFGIYCFSIDKEMLGRC